MLDATPEFIAAAHELRFPGRAGWTSFPLDEHSSVELYCDVVSPRRPWLARLAKSLQLSLSARGRALSWFLRRITRTSTRERRADECCASPRGGEAGSPRSDSGAVSTTRERGLPETPWARCGSWRCPFCSPDGGRCDGSQREPESPR
jgi:hypothetical protein